MLLEECKCLCRGMLVSHNAKATMHECTDSHTRIGCVVKNKSTLVLDRHSSNHAGTGLLAREEFSLTATKCEFKNFQSADLQSRGLVLEGPGIAALKECKIIGVHPTRLSAVMHG